MSAPIWKTCRKCRSGCGRTRSAESVMGRAGEIQGDADEGHQETTTGGTHDLSSPGRRHIPLPGSIAGSSRGDAGWLSAAEAQSRLARYGSNELPEKRTNPLLRLLSSFWGPIPWMIEVAAILSLMIRHWADFGIILALLVVNALVGSSGRNTRPTQPLPRSSPSWRCKPASSATGPGSLFLRVSWCPATWSTFASGRLCPPMPGCWKAIRWRWTSRR